MDIRKWPLGTHEIFKEAMINDNIEFRDIKTNSENKEIIKITKIKLIYSR